MKEKNECIIKAMKNFFSNKRQRHLLLVGSIAVAFVVLNFFAAAPAKNSLAQSSEIPFGGLRFFTLECTCSANFLLYILDYANHSVLALVYQPGGSMLYSYFNIYATYLKGSYTPGAGQCQIYAGTSCSQVNSDGQLGSMPGTGTSDI